MIVEILVSEGKVPVIPFNDECRNTKFLRVKFQLSHLTMSVEILVSEGKVPVIPFNDDCRNTSF